MGLLDAEFAGVLPRAATSVFSSIGENALNFNLPSIGTIANESFQAITNTFGSTGPFAKLSTGAPSFKELGAKLAFTGVGSTDIPYSSAASLINAPSVPTSATAINSAVGSNGNTDNTDHKVKLEASSGVIEFDNMPEVNENRNVEYEALQTAQLPGEFQKYRGTRSTSWTITAVLTARTRAEANKNYMYLNILRGWTMPYFGEKQINQFPGKLGAPPPIITFSGWRGIVGPVPTVITVASWSWPKDCDWLPTGVMDDQQQEIPFPSVMNISINLVESFSPEQFNGFDLVAFRLGDMIGAWQPLARTAGSVTAAEPVGGNQGVTNTVPSPANDKQTTAAEPDSNYSNEGRNSTIAPLLSQDLNIDNNPFLDGSN
jgi:hypothetical protein